MVTRYVFHSDGEPIQISYSREPLAVTGGTSVEWPEDGPAPDEVRDLRLPPRSPMMFVIARTYYADGVAVETADIVVPSDRYELVYRTPVR
ncbi:hypothetical protein [Virgisporangium aliadipatigenens]|nr:hypothetical protein [Virgisporangium aliadipatigenens]